MKFNIELEIDWIEEDGSIEEQVKEDLKSQIISKIDKKITSEVNAEIDKSIISKMDTKIQSICDDIVENFMHKQFTKTDRYGDIIETTTLENYLKDTFESYWDEMVDSSGGKSSYNAKKKRVEWIIDEKIMKQSQDFSKSLIKDTEKKIKDYMAIEMKERIGEKFFAELGFSKMLEK